MLTSLCLSHLRDARYFVVLIVLGPWFAVNLALVVIATQFKMTKKRELALQTAMEGTSRHPWETFVIWVVRAAARLIAFVFLTPLLCRTSLVCHLSLQLLVDVTLAMCILF